MTIDAAINTCEGKNILNHIRNQQHDMELRQIIDHIQVNPSPIFGTERAPLVLTSGLL